MDELFPSHADLLQATRVCVHVCVHHSYPLGGEHLQKVITGVQDTLPSSSSSSSPPLCSRTAPGFSGEILRSSAAQLSDMPNSRLPGNTFTTEHANDRLTAADWTAWSEGGGLLHLLYDDVIGTYQRDVRCSTSEIPLCAVVLLNKHQALIFTIIILILIIKYNVF